MKTVGTTILNIGIILLIGTTIWLSPIPDGCIKAGDYLAPPTGGFDNEGRPIGKWETYLPDESKYYTIRISVRGGYHNTNNLELNYLVKGKLTLENKDSHIIQAGWQCNNKLSALRRLWLIRKGYDISPYGIYELEELSPFKDWIGYN